MTASTTVMSRLGEHDVLLAELGTIVKELHENAKDDRAAVMALTTVVTTLGTAVTTLVERDRARGKVTDWLRNALSAVIGGLLLFGLEHIHF